MIFFDENCGKPPSAVCQRVDLEKLFEIKKIVSIGQPSQKLWPFKVFQAKKHKLFMPRQQIAS